MRVIDEHGHRVVFKNDLRTPIDMHAPEGACNRAIWDPDQRQYGNRGHRIVDIVLPRHIHLNLEIRMATHIEADPDEVRTVHVFDVVGHKVGRAVDRIGKHLARCSGEELIRIICIEIDDADTGLFEDAALIVLVLLEIRVLVRSDVIRLDVREDAIVEGDGVDTVELEGLAGGLHHDIITALIPHHAEVVLEVIGLRGRVLRRKVMPAILDAGRTDAADLLAGVLKDLLDHVGGGRLALRSGDGDDRHLPARMIEACRTERREGRPRILHTDD